MLNFIVILYKKKKSLHFHHMYTSDNFGGTLLPATLLYTIMENKGMNSLRPTFQALT